MNHGGFKEVSVQWEEDLVWVLLIEWVVFSLTSSKELPVSIYYTQIWLKDFHKISSLRNFQSLVKDKEIG